MSATTHHNASVNPASIRRARTMTRIRQADAEARWMRQRRDDAHSNGYRGPLTRAELAAQAARQQAGR